MTLAIGFVLTFGIGLLIGMRARRREQCMVENFHRRLGLPIGDYHDPRISNKSFRMSLIEEEWQELNMATTAGDLPEAVDALCDLLYVTYGTAVEWGVDLTPFFFEVHKTNMAKVGGPIARNGKQLKPAGWKPPDIERLLRARGWRGAKL